jgi:hypothetical protein
MPGSATSRDRRRARVDARLHVAFRPDKSVGVPIDNFAAQWLAYALPCRRFAFGLATDDARLGAMRFATPSSQWTGAAYSSPVSRRTVTVTPVIPVIPRNIGSLVSSAPQSSDSSLSRCA